MAFVDVEAATVDKYWNPEEVKEAIEGNVYEIQKDNWGNKRIVLDLGDDEEGNMMKTTLPAHAHLQSFIPNLKIGDYIRVELKELVDPAPEQLEKDPARKPTRKYRVQKDPDKALEYEKQE